MNMTLPDGGGTIAKSSMFSNCGKGAHRSFAWNGLAYMSNIVGLGNNLETMGSGLFSNIICDSFVVGTRALDENFIQCNFSWSYLAGAYGNARAQLSVSPEAQWNNYYFCDSVVIWNSVNNFIDFKGFAAFTNCSNVFQFTSSFCSIFAGGSVFSNCVTRDIGAPVVFIDTATGNQYSPPTELPGGF